MGKWLVDGLCVLLLVGMIVGLFYLFLEALDRDAEFYVERVTMHQQECVEAQQAVRLAEVTR